MLSVYTQLNSNFSTRDSTGILSNHTAPVSLRQRQCIPVSEVGNEDSNPFKHEKIQKSHNLYGIYVRLAQSLSFHVLK